MEDRQHYVHKGLPDEHTVQETDKAPITKSLAWMPARGVMRCAGGHPGFRGI